VGGGLAQALGESLDTADPGLEAAGGVAQGGFGIDPAVAGEVDDGEEHIPQFPGEGGTGGTGPGEFPQLFPEFGGNPFRRIGPIKARPGGAALQVLGIEQGREGTGNPIQATLPGRLFLLLQLVPAAEDLGGVTEFFPAEDVGVAADELVGQFAGDGLEIEGSPLAGELGVEEDMEEDVAQLLLEGVVIALVNGLEELVDLLKDHGAEGAMRLLPVPRTTARAAQASHDPGEGLGFAHGSE